MATYKAPLVTNVGSFHSLSTIFVLVCSEQDLYVLNGLNEQALLLKKELDEDFVCCQAVYEAHGVRIAYELKAFIELGAVPNKERRSDHRLCVGYQAVYPPRLGH